MTRLIWEKDLSRYELGIDRGVLYPENGLGVAWSGLLQVEEGFSGGEVKPYSFDGITYVNIASTKNYSASISALSAPKEFSACVGDYSVVPGFILTKQARTKFGLSYRTSVGFNNDYKIHLVYNVLASVTNRGNYSIGQTFIPNAYKWMITATPVRTEQSIKPSAHYIIHASKIDSEKLLELETILYGSDSSSAYLPTLEEILSILTIGTPE